jgi:putative transposase
MKASQHTAEQIIKVLEQAEKGDQTIGAVCRTNGIAENTFYRWHKTYGGMSVSEAQRLKELEKENTRLKRLLAERMLEVDALKELVTLRPVEVVLFTIIWPNSYNIVLVNLISKSPSTFYHRIRLL